MSNNPILITSETIWYKLNDIIITHSDIQNYSQITDEERNVIFEIFDDIGIKDISEMVIFKNLRTYSSLFY